MVPINAISNNSINLVKNALDCLHISSDSERVSPSLASPSASRATSATPPSARVFSSHSESKHETPHPQSAFCSHDSYPTSEPLNL